MKIGSLFSSLLLLTTSPLFGTGWPLPPGDSVYPLGNNWGNFQDYGSGSYFHNGIDGITVNQHNRPVIAVAKGWVKAWLTIQADWHWRLAISDSNLNFTGRAPGWLYAHIDPNRYHKQEGDSVVPGETIGYLVSWPVSGFDHIHFARISDTGRLWRRGNSQPQNPTWWFIQNPLTIIQPNTDTVRPTFENARANQLFAFCRNNSSTYLDPNNLNGDVDIIAKIYDQTGFTTGNSTWDKLAPYKIKYSIRGRYASIPETLSLIFKYRLPPSGSNEIYAVYKDDATCNSRGDYNNRDYFFIITNTDGDSVIEMADTSGKWRTQNFPDDYYWVKVIAEDVVGNRAAESMLVRTDNSFPIRDVGVTKITSPIGTIDSGMVITPACSVYNYGSANESYRVRMKIGSFYDQTAWVSNHIPGTNRYLTFPQTWRANNPRGTYPVSCSTELAEDMIPNNDRRIDSITIRIRDVGPVVLLLPTTIDSGATVTPACTVYNYGTTTENYTIRMKIGNFYNEVVSISNHTQGTKIYRTFPDWQANQIGTFPVSCSTELVNDMNFGNDKIISEVTVRRNISRDVGVKVIIAPRGDVSYLDSVIPTCTVYNYGTEVSYQVRMKIGDFYDERVSVTNHPPGTKFYLTFPPWWVIQSGIHPVSCSMELFGDMNPENDKKIDSASVIDLPSTRSWRKIAMVPQEPDGKKIKSGGTMTACAGNIYILKGNNTRTLYKYIPGYFLATIEDSVPLGPLRKKIKKGSGMTSDGRYLYIVKGANTREFFRYDTQRQEPVWETLPPVEGEKGLKGGTGICYAGGSIYLLKGSKTTEFYRFDISSMTWHKLKDAPESLGISKGYSDGSCLVAYNDTLLFALRGKYNEFYLYNIKKDSWYRRSPMPLIHPLLKKEKKVKEGAAMTTVYGKIFAFKGGNTGESWLYHPEEDFWEGWDTIPKDEVDRKMVKGGGSLAVGRCLSVYALKGNNTLSIWRCQPVRPSLIDRLEKGINTLFSQKKEGDLRIGNSAKIRIYNSLGVLLFMGRDYERRSETIKLPAGIYFLQRIERDRIYNQKILRIR
uniref:Peptidase M23 domain-containing protein n=1 Tax=candidate division WOR-3 bacterium TaxID=2052148 RepID=A0A7C3YSL9_UNCW3